MEMTLSKKITETLHSLAHVAFMVAFVYLTYVLSLRFLELLEAPRILWIAFPFAVLRVARAVSYNSIFAWLRQPYTKTVRDSSGAGFSVEATDPFGELLACPICSGTWAALVLACLYVIFPNFGGTFIALMAAAGISELFHWWSEAQEWHGRAERERAGTSWLIKNDIRLDGAAEYLKDMDGDGDNR